MSSSNAASSSTLLSIGESNVHLQSHSLQSPNQLTPVFADSNPPVSSLPRKFPDISLHSGPYSVIGVSPTPHIPAAHRAHTCWTFENDISSLGLVIGSSIAISHNQFPRNLVVVREPVRCAFTSPSPFVPSPDMPSPPSQPQFSRLFVLEKAKGDTTDDWGPSPLSPTFSSDTATGRARWIRNVFTII
ncbi:hypothetical protein DL96DRAFT_1716970 [Flagelloscypha sp. PMI_526]|nr:hypothetical protein DL96DRAFT_1716970 [Flagelloscypha sp. PMI_526]